MSSWTWTPWLGALPLTLLSMLAVAALLWCYRDQPRRDALLILIRVAGLAAAMLLVLNPLLVSHEERRVAPRVGVLVDASASMELPASAQSERTRAEEAHSLLEGTVEAAGLLATLGDQVEVSQFRFAGALVEVEPDGSSAGSTLAPAEEGTALAESIEAARRELEFGHLEALVLLSDGRGTTSGSATAVAARCGRQGVPVHVVPIGPVESRDLFVESISGPDLTFLGDEWRLEAAIGRSGTGSEVCEVTLTLEHERDGQAVPVGDPVVEQVELGADLHRIRYPLNRPDSAGFWTFRARVRGTAPDGTPTNDERSIRLRVVENELRVLFIEGRPRWEWRFLRNVMQRDARTRDQLKTVLDTSTSVGRSVTGAELIPLPDKDQIEDYDVLIIGDVPPARFDSDWLEELEEHVSASGAGLLFVAGSRHTRHFGQKPRLAGLMPVRPKSLSSRKPGRGLVITPAGAASTSYFGFSSSTQRLRRWRGPAEMSRIFAGEIAQPDLVTPLLVDGDQVVAAEMRVGLGFSAYFGFDESWRWREFDEGREHERFWGRTIQRLGMQRLRLRYSADELHVKPGRIEVGESVDLILTTARPRDDERVLAEVVSLERPDATRQAELRAPGGDRSRREFRRSFRADVPGEYEVEVRLVDGDEEKLLVEAFTVEAPRGEMEAETADLVTLRAIADASGGLTLGDDPDWESVFAAISTEPIVLREEKRRPAVDLSWSLAVALIMLTLEWSLRRWRGMR